MALDPHSPEFAAKATDVRTMGDDEIREAAETSNRLLQPPVRRMQEGGLSEASNVGSSLLELRRTVEDLDPKDATGVNASCSASSRSATSCATTSIEYESAQTHLDAIIKAPC